MTEQRPRQSLETRLNNLSSYSRQRGNKATNLMSLFTVENLSEWYCMLRKHAAAGVDKVTYDEYGENLMENLKDLVQRMRQWSYRPQPVRRVYIPKGDGKQLRPLGIPALEDKIVQEGMAQILNAIFEPLFLESSYGFRPKRGCHDALRAVDEAIMQHPTNWIIDADIKDYFGSVSHEWLIKAIEFKVGDSQFIRLLKRFLKAGVMEDGQWRETEEGTPQGGIISPILSNVYLHYVLDCWVEREIKPHCKGYVCLVRYADDFLLCAQKKEEAIWIYAMLEERLKEFGLSLSKEKTRVIPFGRYARENAKKKGQKPLTFDFLGFTHYNDKTRKDGYKLGRRTSAKKFRAKIRAMKEWVVKVRYAAPIHDWWKTLAAKLRGHYQYYGVSGNMMRMRAYYQQVIHLVIKWVCRMSQKRLQAKKKLLKFMEANPLPRPKIYVNMYAFGYQRA